MIAFLAGLVVATGPSIDIRVDGQGMLRFAREGRAVYAKKAHLTVGDGVLGLQGVSLLPEIRVPSGVQTLNIDLEGNVKGSGRGMTVSLGKLVIALFGNEGALMADGSFMIAADRPRLVEPGDGTAGVIRTTDQTATTKAATGADAAPSTQPAIRIQHSTSSAQAPAPNSERQATSASIRIELNPSSEVSGSKILLGEIATIEGDKAACEKLDKLEVGDSPAFGVTRGLDKTSIEGRLAIAGYKVADFTLNVPAGCKVRRKGQTVANDRFVQTAINAAKAQNPGQTFRCEQPAIDANVPVGNCELVSEAINPSKGGVNVTLGIFIDGKRTNSRIVVLKCDSPTEGVRAGQPVKIFLRSMGAVVQINGKTRTGGLVGQSVTVVADTGSVHQGTVLGPDQVEVKL